MWHGVGWGYLLAWSGEGRGSSCGMKWGGEGVVMWHRVGGGSYVAWNAPGIRKLKLMTCIRNYIIRSDTELLFVLEIPDQIFTMLQTLCL